jgi:cobalt-zinc-cadmium efflux system outer membrane protein
VDAASDSSPVVGQQSLSLQTALYGALTNNPDLVSLRQGNAIANAPSPEAVEVARRFPVTLNPTLWLDYRPLTLIPNNVGGASPGGRNRDRDFYRSGNQFLYLSLRQPLELGHQTTHRFNIAKAALSQQRWTVLQAELTALVQTYRVFQTAAYRREKLRVASDLADFNDHLLKSLERRLEANQAAAADVILARLETRSARQLVKAARQDYLTALADLRNQVGVTDAAGAIEPLGEFTLPPYIPPLEEQVMIQSALENRPDIHAARAQVAGAEAAVRLARADRIPSPVVGPEYQANESGTQFVGFVYITPLPILNSGKALVVQRQAESRRACVVLQQAQQRAISQVRSAVSKWNGATELVNETAQLTGDLGGEVAKLERLFDEGQADLTKLLQGRQRLILLENSRLDAIWAATQAQADLLLAMGTPALINAMLAKAETDAGVGSATNPSSAPRPGPKPKSDVQERK